jgi:hypothetical protein
MKARTPHEAGTVEVVDAVTDRPRPARPPARPLTEAAAALLDRAGAPVAVVCAACATPTRLPPSLAYRGVTLPCPGCGAPMRIVAARISIEE